MQILLVYYEPLESGQTTHVLSLAKGLIRRGFQAEVILPDHLAIASSWFQHIGVRVTGLAMRKAYWKPQAVYRFTYLIRMLRPEVVHIHSQEAAMVARLPAKLAGARTIFYTPQTVDIRQKHYYRLYSALEQWQSSFTDRIISVNKADRKRMETWGIDSKKTVTIYNGIDPDDFNHPNNPGEIRASLGVRPSGPLVMQIGRLTPQKSPLDFIEGAAIVLQSRSDVQFVLIGDGPLQAAVAQRVRQIGLDGSLILAGRRESAYQLMPAADIVTLTSQWEGTPYTILEAMAWGKPVVATAVNGIPEIVQDKGSGILVPPADPASWAQAVLKLLDDPGAAEKFGNVGKERVKDKFTLDQMVNNLIDLYGQAEFRIK